MPRTSCTWLSMVQGLMRPSPGATSMVVGGEDWMRGYSNWSTTCGVRWSISTTGSMWSIEATEGVPSWSKTKTM